MKKMITLILMLFVAITITSCSDKSAGRTEGEVDTDIGVLGGPCDEDGKCNEGLECEESLLYFTDRIETSLICVQQEIYPDCQANSDCNDCEKCDWKPGDSLHGTCEPIVGCVPEEEDSDAIEFEHEVLEYKISDALVKLAENDPNFDFEHGDVVTEEACSHLKYLNIACLYNDEACDKIDSLSGLERCVNIERIWADNNNISNIAPLEGLTELELVGLNINDISDITPLENLSKLISLHISSNDIVDISPLKNLVNLSTLHLNNNKELSDITPLISLTNIRSLYLNKNKITNIAALILNARFVSMQAAGILNTDRTFSLSDNTITAGQIDDLKAWGITVIDDQ